MRIKVCLLVVLILNVQKAVGQTIQRLGAKGSAGMIIPHSADLRPISQSTPLGLSATYQWMNTDRSSWEACDCFYYLGVEAFYYNFNSPSVLGSATGISGSFEPILWRNKSWEFSLNSGIGVSYLSEVYDSVSNPENLFFSQPLSFLLFLSPTVQYRFSSRWSAQFSLSYHHISNGGQKQPNKGMNFPTIGLGVYRYLSDPEFPIHKKGPVAPSWKILTEVAYTSTSAEGGTREPLLMLAAELYRPLFNINALGIGMDLSKDHTLGREQPYFRTIMPAPFVAHHFILGRIDFSQWMAFYLNKPNNYNNHRFYQRYILRYKILDNLSAGVGLKVHGHVAENIDIRLAWHW